MCIAMSPEMSFLHLDARCVFPRRSNSRELRVLLAMLEPISDLLLSASESYWPQPWLLHPVWMSTGALPSSSLCLRGLQVFLRLPGGLFLLISYTLIFFPVSEQLYVAIGNQLLFLQTGHLQLQVKDAGQASAVVRICSPTTLGGRSRGITSWRSSFAMWVPG